MPKKLFAHFTDSHLGQRLRLDGGVLGNKMRYENQSEEHTERLRLVLDDIARQGITEVIFGGDIGTRASVAGFFGLLQSYPFKVTILLGNHDDYDNVALHHDFPAGGVNGKACFSLDDGSWKRIFLDSSDNTIGAAQLDWLTQELAGVRKAALFVHHPVLPIDTPLERAGAALREGVRLQSLLKAAACEVALFCGHYHMNDEAREANIHQFVTPAVSYQIAKEAEQVQADANTFGYRILEFDGAEIKTEVVLLTKDTLGTLAL
jgi:3',5'-cyclic-AMP phosphodiesterase